MQERIVGTSAPVKSVYASAPIAAAAAAQMGTEIRKASHDDKDSNRLTAIKINPTTAVT
ncbi:hypothetical protein GCM10022269_22180 [Sphingorhabdus rigui]